MIKTISKVGNSNGIIFDATIMDLARLQTGDQVNLEIHEGGTITLTPIRPQPSREQVTKTIKSTVKNYARTEAVGMSVSPNNCFHLTVENVREIHSAAIESFGGPRRARHLTPGIGGGRASSQFRRPIALSGFDGRGGGVFVLPLSKSSVP